MTATLLIVFALLTINVPAQANDRDPFCPYNTEARCAGGGGGNGLGGNGNGK